VRLATTRDPCTVPAVHCPVEPTSRALTPKQTLQWRSRISLAIQIWFWYGRVRLRLQRSTLPEMVAWLATTRGSGVPAVEPRRLGRIVDRILPPRLSGATCLTRSLILYRLLHLQGRRPQLVVGLPHHPKDHEAHAWIELDGTDVGPPPGGRRFTPLARYHASSAEP
jgi:hypothetical protein